MKVLYFDCFAGISGDMTLGAMLDMGVDKEVFLNEIAKIKVEGFSIDVSKVKKKGITGTDVNVKIPHEHHHHHDMHDKKHHHHHAHRNLHDVEKIINESELTQTVKDLSKEMFMKVAEAEAKVHGVDIEEIHFHEVGALDSIVDIIGTAICIDMIKPDKIISSPLHTGKGFIKCQHGMMPVPAPATLEIMREAAIPFYAKDIEKELVTPTGAAIIATLAQGFESMPEMVVEKVGYGAGKRDMEIPNLLRVSLGELKKNSI